MKRYATITGFTEYDQEEEQRITWLFERIFKTKFIRVSYDYEELCYYVVAEGGVE